MVLEPCGGPITDENLPNRTFTCTDWLVWFWMPPLRGQVVAPENSKVNSFNKNLLNVYYIQKRGPLCIIVQVVPYKRALGQDNHESLDSECQAFWKCHMNQL